MDPNANLAEQRRIAARMIENDEDRPLLAYRLAELVEALDEWITNGGFLPSAWVRR